jgi:hypothetical protein
MTVVVQQLRTTSATALPASLQPGQLALNLANGWILMGDGSNGVSAAGVGLAAGCNTIFGVAGVTVPATPPVGLGYEIYELKNPQCGSSVPLAPRSMLPMAAQAP